MATLVLPTKTPLNWARARWPEGSLFDHWRSGVTFAQVSCRSTRRGVREHPAPSGALRQFVAMRLVRKNLTVREHPAPSGALRPVPGDPAFRARFRQGAPSTIRCIKTPDVGTVPTDANGVREHPAPSGALRPSPGRIGGRTPCVREHPAPSGALRPCKSIFFPSSFIQPVREHPAPSGALRRRRFDRQVKLRRRSGSTQHHQVH